MIAVSKFYAAVLKAMIPLFIFFSFAGTCPAQDNSGDEDNQSPVHTPKGFHVGMFLGSYFANKYSAYTYDGYGFDVNGNKNNFYNSILYRRIVYDYGGGNNQPDRIAPALGVAPGEWSFDSTDMPTRMQYNVAFRLGLNTRYCFDEKNSFIFNLDAIKLTAHGDFSILKKNYNTSTTSGLQGAYIYQAFAIIGTEQRLMLQAGYQSIVGEKDQVFNFFYELGPDLVLAKYDRNFTDINGLSIDLTAYYTQPLPGYSPYRPKNLTGEGLGVFAGMGVNVNTHTKWSMQFLYSPSYDLIKIGQYPRRTLQNSIGLRAYYNL